MVAGSIETTSRPSGAVTLSGPRLMVAMPSWRCDSSTVTPTMKGWSLRTAFLLPANRTFTLPTGLMMMNPWGRL